MKEYKKVYQQVKNSDDIYAFVKDREEQLIEENVTQYKGSLWSKGKKIGPNHAVGGQTSACSEFLMQDRMIIVDSGIVGAILKTGNIDNVYVWMFKNLLNNDMENCSEESLVSFVYLLCNSYFGSEGDANVRMQILNSAEIVALSDFKGKNAAQCVERATLCHNLFKMLGVDSTLKQSTIIYNDVTSIHAYNLLRIDGNNFVFDASIPKKNEVGEKDPMVGSLSDKEYMLMIDGRRKVGCHIKNMNNGVVYDSSFRYCEEELNSMPLEMVEEIMEQAHFVNNFSDADYKLTDKSSVGKK